MLAFIGNKYGLYAPALDWTGLIIPGIIDLHYFGSRVSLRLAEGPLFHVVARLLGSRALLVRPGTPSFWRVWSPLPPTVLVSIKDT